MIDLAGSSLPESDGAVFIPKSAADALMMMGARTLYGISVHGRGSVNDYEKISSGVIRCEAIYDRRGDQEGFFALRAAWRSVWLHRENPYTKVLADHLLGHYTAHGRVNATVKLPPWLYAIVTDFGEHTLGETPEMMIVHGHARQRVREAHLYPTHHNLVPHGQLHIEVA